MEKVGPSGSDFQLSLPAWLQDWSIQIGARMNTVPVVSIALVAALCLALNGYIAIPMVICIVAAIFEFFVIGKGIEV